MPKRWTHAECFASYGTKAKNPRWSWSARSDDGKVVAVTFWQDRFEEGGRRYSSHRHLSDDWQGRTSPGHPELLKNLAWARDNCEGLIRIIVAIPKNPNASPRAIKECFPAPQILMQVVQLDEVTGDFVAERITT